MPTQGEARKSQSSINFHTAPRNDENHTNQEPLRANKRPRTETEMNDMLTPGISITEPTENLHESASVNTVIETPMVSSLNNYDITKLERLVDKNDRYESHKGFLQQCIRDKIIPVGLQINLTPTIGKYNDEFVEKWHKRLEEFSLTIIQDIVDFCETTLGETKEAVETAKENIRATASPDENKTVLESIHADQKIRKENLRRGKQKKIHFLNYKQSKFQNNNFDNNNFPRNNFRNNNNQSGYVQQNYTKPNHNSPPQRVIQTNNRLNSTEQNQSSRNPTRQQSSTLLGRRRSNNRLHNHQTITRTNNEQPRLWSSLLKPSQHNAGAGTNDNQVKPN